MKDSRNKLNLKVRGDSMFDCHLHTEFSTDSKMKIEEAIEKAKNLNLGLVLTEHLDINYPEKGLFTFDVQEYFKV